MICVITQPRFFPGLHYLHRMMLADVFVVLDTVKFNRRHEENRAKLKGPEGGQWLTVPTRCAGERRLIQDVAVDYTQPWQPRALKTLKHLYGKSPLYEEFLPEVAKAIEEPQTGLSELDRASWQPALDRLGVGCEFAYASKLPVSGGGWELLLEICKHVGADTYLSGGFGRDYIDPAAFRAAGIDLAFHEYVYPEYEQRFGEFLPFLSYLDVLFNTGLDRDLVSSGGSCRA